MLYAKRKKKIKLPNRDGYNASLEQEDKNTYLFVTNAPFIRLSEKDNEELSFIDPSGGPMLSVGDSMDIGTIVSIKSSKDGYLITIK